MTSYKINFQDNVFSCKDNETLINAFIRHGIVVDFSCRKGSCHVCMMQCNTGVIPENSQINLKIDYVNQGYFLPCTCIPESDMSLVEIQNSSIYKPAIIHQKKLLSPNVCQVLIEPADEFTYNPGQYINLKRISDNIARSYSLVSHPDDYFIEIHVKKMHNGALSTWIFDELEEGNEIEYQGALGKNHYGQVEDRNKPLIFIGKGTGIAPIYGILKDALRHNHNGDIYIYHDGDSINDIYLHNEMIAIDQEHENVNYTACVEGKNNPYFSPHNTLSLLENSIGNIFDKAGTPSLFIAGSPDFIMAIQTLLKHHNIPANCIFSDSFDYKDRRAEKKSKLIELGRRKSDSQTINQTSAAKQIESRDDEMWLALDSGKKLKTILDDFYSIVYQDSKLSGFFQNTTEKRSSEKQYLFMRQLFTGEKVYFGDRPKNAHHWMVISNELFDYREKVLSKCLNKHGLAEHLIQRWVDIDNSFRNDIVKRSPFPKVINGVEMPLNGYETLKIDEGTICDGCHEAIEKGEIVRYHLRLGLTYCGHCMESNISEKAV